MHNPGLSQYKNSMPSVAFVLTENMLATSAIWPSDILASANQVGKKLCPDKAAFESLTVASQYQGYRTHSGIQLMPDATIDEIDSVDIIYLPSLWRNPQTVIRQNQALLSWLQKMYEQGSLIAAVGTGVCVLAETGLLDNKPATTHWYYFDPFAKRYPRVQLKQQHFITQASNLYCAASINSIADLTIHFIQRFFNKPVAQHIQRHFSHEVRKDYEAVSFFETESSNHPDEDILQLQLWLKGNVDKTISLEAMADYCQMSKRNLSRRFKQATGKTPQHYLKAARLNVARDLLQSSNLSIGDIADKTGFNDASHFSQTFQKFFSTTPSEFRTSVRAKLFSL